MPTGESFVRARDVARYLGLSTSLIRKKTTDTYDPIPHHRLPKSRSVLYRLSEVDEWVLGSGRDA
jgi:predicted DNA-binding transcriptional regulator AlpA